MNNFGYPKWSNWCPSQTHRLMKNEHLDRDLNFRGTQTHDYSLPQIYGFQHQERRTYTSGYKCFRCGKYGHLIKQCKSDVKKPKSANKIKRDRERLQNFMIQKLCQIFPFSELDDSDFLNTVTDIHSGFRLEMQHLNKEIDHYYQAWLDHSVISNKLRREASHLHLENSKLRENIEELKTQLSELQGEKVKRAELESVNRTLSGQLQDEQRKVRELREHIRKSSQELEDEKAEYRNALKEMEYKMFFDRELEEWKQLC